MRNTIMLGMVGAALCVALPFIAVAQIKAPAVEFVQAARGMTFKDGVLTLTDVSPATIFFSDRPQRLTGHVRNDHFVKNWSQGPDNFKSNPPNATLSVFDGTARPTQVVLVLKNPQAAERSIAYDVTVLQGSLPPQAGESTLFIDGGNIPCNSDLNDPMYSTYPCWAQTAFSGGH